MIAIICAPGSSTDPGAPGESIGVLAALSVTELPAIVHGSAVDVRHTLDRRGSLGDAASGSVFLRRAASPSVSVANPSSRRRGTAYARFMVKAALDTVGRVYDVMQNVKAFCGALAAVVMGVILYLDPWGKIVEDMAFHRELGAGCVGFGVLFLLAMLSRGSAKVRLTSLLFLLVAAGVIAATWWLFAPQVQKAHALASRGEIIDATVVNLPSPFPSKSGLYSTTVRYAGGAATIPLKHRVKRGATLAIRHVPDLRDAVVAAEAGTSFWSILCWSSGQGGVLAVLGIALLALLSLPFNLVNLIRGKPSSA